MKKLLTISITAFLISCTFAINSNLSTETPLPIITQVKTETPTIAAVSATATLESPSIFFSLDEMESMRNACWPKYNRFLQVVTFAGGANIFNAPIHPCYVNGVDAVLSARGIDTTLYSEQQKKAIAGINTIGWQEGSWSGPIEGKTYLMYVLHGSGMPVSGSQRITERPLVDWGFTEDNFYFEMVRAENSPPNLDPINILPASVGLLEIPANPEKGFKWPYLLYIPRVITSNRILVVPNNTGHVDNDFSTHRSSAMNTMSSRIDWANKLHIPIIVPIFPRFEDDSDSTIASQYLGRGSLEEFWQNKYPDIAREDLQLIAMIDDTRERLTSLNVEVDEKIFIEGYSASAMFTSRFTILHPERVQAAAFGGHGWTIVPTDKWEEISLPYPYGTGDIETLTGEAFKIEEFKKVAIFSYMGEADNNSWALPWYIGDGQGRSSYYSHFKSLFGSSSKELSDSANQIYQKLNCSADFVMYKNQGHQSAYTHDFEIMEFFQNHK